MGLVDDRLGRGLRLREVGSLGDQTLEFDHRARGADRGHDLLKHLPVHEEVAGVGVDRDIGLQAAEQFLLVIRRNVDHAVDLAFEEEILGLLHARRIVGHIGVRPGVEGFDQAAAGRRAAFVHHADRHVAEHLRPVSHRVDGGVDDQRENEDQDHARIGEDRAELVAHDRQHLLPIRGHLMCETAHAITSPSIFPPCRWSAGAAGTEAVRQ